MSIQFIEHGSTVGYQARCGAAGSGNSRFFAIRKYGKRQALALAKRAEAEMYSGNRTKHGTRTVANANSASGVVGIRLRIVVDGAGATRCSVAASWTEQGHARSTTYSVARHGKLGATERAMRAREIGTGVRYASTPRQVWLKLTRSER